MLLRRLDRYIKLQFPLLKISCKLNHLFFVCEEKKLRLNHLNYNRTGQLRLLTILMNFLYLIRGWSFGMELGTNTVTTLIINTAYTTTPIQEYTIHYFIV